ncbi:MAG: hypothetical protein WBC92_03560 [Terracidiphilus sp.]
MVVTSQFTGHRVTGLYIGADNVRLYFPRHIAEIELQLDHLRIGCELAPDFWQGQPEIHDPRLCLWLEMKQLKLNGNGEHTSFHLAMIPSGENSFIVGPVTLSTSARRQRPLVPVATRRTALTKVPMGGAAA